MEDFMPTKINGKWFCTKHNMELQHCYGTLVCPKCPECKTTVEHGFNPKDYDEYTDPSELEDAYKMAEQIPNDEIDYFDPDRPDYM